MSRRKTKLYLISIIFFALTFILPNFIFPKFFNLDGPSIGEGASFLFLIILIWPALGIFFFVKAIRSK